MDIKLIDMKTLNKCILCSLKTVQIYWWSLRILNHMCNILVIHYLFMPRSKIEFIPIVLASLEPMTPATLRVLVTVCNKNSRENVNCDHSLGVREF